MDSISQGFGNLSTTLSTAASDFSKAVPVDVAGNKTNAFGRGIDDFLRGVFSGVPGALAKSTALDRDSGGTVGDITPRVEINSQQKVQQTRQKKARQAAPKANTFLGEIEEDKRGKTLGAQ